MSTRPTGYTLIRLTAQWVDMHTLLSDLARAAGDVPWGVDAGGQLFFNKFPTSGRVSASQVDVDPLPVDADDVWGSVILYHPQTGYAYRYEGDARYGERVVAVPNLLDYMNQLQGSYEYDANLSGNVLYRINMFSMATVSFIDNPQLLRDGGDGTGYRLYRPSSTSTACSPMIGRGAILFTPTTWPTGSDILIVTSVRKHLVQGQYNTPWPPILSKGYSTDDVISHLDGRQVSVYRVPATPPAWLRVAIETPSNCEGYDLYVYEFNPLVHSARLQSLAQSLLQPPYLSPQDIRITGHVASANYLHVDGLGTLEIDTWEYEYTMERGLLTTARVGRRGSEHQQSQRIAITGLSREWAERLRLSIGRTT